MQLSDFVLSNLSIPSPSLPLCASCREGDRETGGQGPSRRYRHGQGQCPALQGSCAPRAALEAPQRKASPTAPSAGTNPSAAVAAAAHNLRCGRRCAATAAAAGVAYTARGTAAAGPPELSRSRLLRPRLARPGRASTAPVRDGVREAPPGRCAPRPAVRLVLKRQQQYEVAGHTMSESSLACRAEPPL
jgi:hypothetical protein